LMSSVSFKVINSKVYFNGEERDCVPNEKDGVRWIECDANYIPENRVENQPVLYSFLLHEIYVYAHIEKARNSRVPSTYEESSKLADTANLSLVTQEVWTPGHRKARPVCTVKLWEPSVAHHNTHIYRSGMAGRSRIDSSRGVSDVAKMLLRKGYTPIYSDDLSTYHLESNLDYSLDAFGAWYSVELSLKVNYNLIALGSAKAKRFNLDFLAENSPAFEKMREKAYQEAITDLEKNLPVCR
jgi:hypothetical protein